jgi:hypothetical protein
MAFGVDRERSRTVELSLGPQIFDLLIIAVSKFVGRPLRRPRAKRLARRGKVNCVLFAPENPRLMRGRFVSGAAEVWPGRLRLWDADLRIQRVDLPGNRAQPRRSDGDIWPLLDTYLHASNPSRNPESGGAGLAGRMGGVAPLPASGL